MSRRAVEILATGPLATIQDRGRPGYAHLGVPRSGALDRPAAETANRLVGNPVDAAVIEVTVGGLAFRPDAALTVAVTGCRTPVRVDGRAAAHGEAVSLRAGQVVELGEAVDGLRAYVAVAGGLGVDPVLGSRSTDVLSHTGPPPLARGTVIPVGIARGRPRDVPAVAGVRAGGVVRVEPGPRADWVRGGLNALVSGVWCVSADSNRVGVRLDGQPLARARDDELPSEGLVLGAVQVPPSGRPVVFLHDHPTTGGYPVVAVVAEADLPVLAQARPGATVRFRAAGE